MEAINQCQAAVIDPAAYAVSWEAPRPAAGRWTIGAALFLLFLVIAGYASAANPGARAQVIAGPVAADRGSR
jgi:hypothetical protein